MVRRREVWLFSFLSPTCSWPGPLCSLCVQTPPRGEERQARTQPKTPQSSGLTVRATPNLETGPASCPCMTQTFSLSFKSLSWAEVGLCGQLMWSSRPLLMGPALKPRCRPHGACKPPASLHKDDRHSVMGQAELAQKQRGSQLLLCAYLNL